MSPDQKTSTRSRPLPKLGRSRSLDSDDEDAQKACASTEAKELVSGCMKNIVDSSVTDELLPSGHSASKDAPRAMHKAEGTSTLPISVLVRCSGIKKRGGRCKRKKPLPILSTRAGWYCHDHENQYNPPAEFTCNCGKGMSIPHTFVTARELLPSGRSTSKDAPRAMHKAEGTSTLPISVLVQCSGIKKGGGRCENPRRLSILSAQAGWYCQHHENQRPAEFTGNCGKGSAALLDGVVRCKGVVKSTTRLDGSCNNKTTFCMSAQAGEFYRGCGTETLGPSRDFTSRRHWIESCHDNCIRGYLQLKTQATMRRVMQGYPAYSDNPGYIYAFEVKDPNFPEELIMKVGREKHFNGHVKYWTKHYGTEVVRLGVFPRSSDNNEIAVANWMPLNLMVPAYKRVEKLVLLELGDLAQHAAYHDPDFPNVKVPPTPRPKRTLNCFKATCKVKHREVFPFDPGFQDIDKLVNNVIERWMAFCKAFY